jgi:hypothetical protein
MEQLESVLAQLFSAYPNAKIDEGTVAVYTRLLSDIPPADLQTVVDQCIATCKFLPTVAEIREEWHKLTRQIGQPSATEAWAEVVQQIRAVGYIGVPTFTNPVTAAVVKSMGWRELCASENQVADRAHFLRMYEQLVERGDSVRKLLPQSVELAERRVGSLTHIIRLLPLALKEN